MSDLRARCAVVGVGLAGIPQMPPGSTPIDAMALAAAAACEDAGLSLADIDGVFASGLQCFMPAFDLCGMLQLAPRYADTTQIGGGAPLAQLDHARAAIACGLCDVALIAYGSTQRSTADGFASRSEPIAYEAALGWPGPVAAYAMVAQRHIHEFGTRREDLAEVAVAARLWAQRTPGAAAREPLTAQDVLAARPVATPFTAHDCCLVTDGGGAIVVTAAERARSLHAPPVYVLGIGTRVTHRSIAQMPDLTTTAAVESGRTAYAQARLGPRDIHVRQLYDAFTINPIVFLEDLGFCPKGEGGRFVAEGRLRPGGSHPTNTNGGGLSFCHPGMYGIFTIIETVLQLRGGLDARQVEGATVGLAHAPGGFMASQSTAIFGTQATI